MNFGPSRLTAILKRIFIARFGKITFCLIFRKNKKNRVKQWFSATTDLEFKFNLGKKC